MHLIPKILNIFPIIVYLNFKTLSAMIKVLEEIFFFSLMSLLVCFSDLTSTLPSQTLAEVNEQNSSYVRQAISCGLWMYPFSLNFESNSDRPDTNVVWLPAQFFGGSSRMHVQCSFIGFSVYLRGQLRGLQPWVHLRGGPQIGPKQPSK